MKSQALTFLFILLYFNLIGQKEKNNWYFGTNAGLDFNSGTAVALTNVALATNEGSSAISDKITGNVLFYTDGCSVWNANDSVMPNGTGLLGHASASQSALIVHDPGDENQYYIFTVGAQAGFFGAFGGMAWSKVNMTLNGGLGDVISKNNILLPFTSEKLCVTRHCNGKDYWVIGHGWGTDSFYVYQLTPSGILPPVVSGIGTVYSDIGSGQNSEAIGCMKISPDGEKLALGVFFMLDVFELFDFDNSSGVISNPVTRVFPVPVSDGGPYGIAFSPNSSKVYLSWSSPLETNYILQFDLSLGTPAAILASETTVAVASQVSTQGGFGALQLATDGKIYIACSGALPAKTYVQTIDFPDIAGVACSYNVSPVYIGGNCAYGLPNFNDCSLLIPVPDLGPDSTISSTTLFNLSAPFGSQSYLWSTGQTDSTISITVSSDTTIWVTVVNTNGCSQSDTIHIFFNTGASIDDPQNQKTTVFPNPFHTTFIIRPATGEVISSVKLFDLSGRTVFQSNAGINSFDPGPLSAGIYLLELQMTSGKMFREKIIRQ